MIVTVKLLGLRARNSAHVAAAARRVVDYVRGAPPRDTAAGATAAYYVREHAQGTARGRGAALVGLSGSVDPDHLHRILMGRHAVTGRPLLDPVGSAGRVDRPPAEAGTGDVLTLAEAAALADVDESYLRRLARQTAREANGAGDRDVSALARDRLAAFKDPDGRWKVRRDELLRYLAEREPPTVVLGYDVTCAAPKSVSLLWAFGDQELRADIGAALAAGVDAVVGYLERSATFGTVENRNRPALGLAVASYRHEVSRSDEAHLHVHNIVANAVAVPVLTDEGVPVRDTDGHATVVWRALDSEVFLSHVKTAGYLGAAALRGELARRRGLSWAAVRNGVAELDGFPADLLAAFSTRAGEVHEEFAQLVEQGMVPDAATRMAAQRGSRAPKKVLADAEVRAAQLARLTDAGWTPAQVRALGARRERDIDAPSARDVQNLVDRLLGRGGLTAQATTFSLREATQAVAAWSSDRMRPEEITNLAEQVLAGEDAVLMSVNGRRRRQDGNERTYTTLDLLEAEDSLLSLYWQGRTDRGGRPRALLQPDAVESLLDSAANSGPGSASLSREQRAAVRAVLTATDLVRLFVGAAGTGKTTAMRTAATVLAGYGHLVVGAAHGGRQTEQITEALGVLARVVTGWLTLLDHADDPAEHWPPGTVLIVDEATQVATRDAERLLRYATRTGTVVILVGDPAQLGSVGAGGWFAHLIDLVPDAIRLDTVRRQSGPEMAAVRAALAGLRSPADGDVSDALERLARDGHLTVYDNRDELLGAVVDDWYADRTSHTDGATSHPPEAASMTAPGARMMAEFHRDVEAMNIAARARLTADGTLTGPPLTVAGREFRVGDEVITLTQQGHTLIPAGSYRGDYIRTGTVGTVTAVTIDPEQPPGHSVTVTFPGRGTVTIGWAYLTHHFPDGRDGGLAHAYAVTAAKAEGSTMPTARALVVDDTSRAGLYVMLSRGQRQLRAYTIRRPDLEAHLEDEDWLPILPHGRAMDRLADRIRASRSQRLAADIDPVARAAHRLARGHDLASLALLHDERRGTDQHVLRRAELAVETAVATRAVSSPPAALTARLGPRPDAGPDLDLWDRAVGALAIYRARHLPDGPPDQPGSVPPPGTDPAGRWQELRDQANLIAVIWLEGLTSAARERFHAQVEAIPRARATAGIHALLDSGQPADDITRRLTRPEPDDIRSAAAVLDHRVAGLCRAAGLDPAGYELPAPLTAQQDWTHVTHLLDEAEITHIARQPTRTLADTTRTQRAIGADADTDEGLRRVEAALTRQVDHAMTRIRQEAAPYLGDLLGAPPRPGGPDTADWHRRAHAIEDYRHRVLGLHYGQPAEPDGATPSIRALGRPPADPRLWAAYRELINPSDQLDLDL